MKHIPSNILVPSVLYMVYLVFLLQILFLPLLFIFFFFFRPTLFNKSFSMDSVKLTQLNSSLQSRCSSWRCTWQVLTETSFYETSKRKVWYRIIFFSPPSPLPEKERSGPGSGHAIRRPFVSSRERMIVHIVRRMIGPGIGKKAGLSGSSRFGRWRDLYDAATAAAYA